MQKPFYIAAVIADDVAKQLRKLAIHPTILCHHITIAYAPDEKTWQEYADLVGKRLEFVTEELRVDAYGQAVSVSGIPSEKTHPHITISCATGVKATYSNELFTKEAGVIREPHVLHGYAMVELIKIYNTKTLS